MPQQSWSKKRDRQYEHIKGGLERRGKSEDLAEEIAARTVNKERARAGESRESSADVDARCLVGSTTGVCDRIEVRVAEPRSSSTPRLGTRV